ncbi:MAG: hypothetical protein EOP45_11630 [Sphingobacteriaceae bacterium]|nr:MAG: hypothetical protein EOP45_11630 [Sphingobacteriaceae bacterium]
MFSFDVEKERYTLKSLNCPGHCILFKSRDRSYRDLPLRFTEFGILHSNEPCVDLNLFTSRRFVQDDAHIFCRVDQVCID